MDNAEAVVFILQALGFGVWDIQMQAVSPSNQQTQVALAFHNVFLKAKAEITVNYSLKT